MDLVLFLLMNFSICFEIPLSDMSKTGNRYPLVYAKTWNNENNANGNNGISTYGLTKSKTLPNKKYWVLSSFKIWLTLRAFLVINWYNNIPKLSIMPSNANWYQNL